MAGLIMLWRSAATGVERHRSARQKTDLENKLASYEDEAGAQPLGTSEDDDAPASPANHVVMRAWKQNDSSPFTFADAHDINAALDSSTEATISAGWASASRLQRSS